MSYGAVNISDLPKSARDKVDQLAQANGGKIEIIDWDYCWRVYFPETERYFLVSSGGGHSRCDDLGCYRPGLR